MLLDKRSRSRSWRSNLIPYFGETQTPPNRCWFHNRSYVKFRGEIGKAKFLARGQRRIKRRAIQSADVAVPIGGDVAIPVGRAAIGDILIVEILEIIPRRGRAGVAVHFANIKSVDANLVGVIKVTGTPVVMSGESSVWKVDSV